LLDAVSFIVMTIISCWNRQVAEPVCLAGLSSGGFLKPYGWLMVECPGRYARVGLCKGSSGGPSALMRDAKDEA
jgi:hypothetical protein